MDINLAEIAQVITALAALGALGMSYRNSKKIAEVHVSINSRMDQLLNATGISERAAGAKEERDRKAEG
jgi:hypothetical protein